LIAAPLESAPETSKHIFVSAQYTVKLISAAAATVPGDNPESSAIISASGSICGRLYRPSEDFP
jgi:hypothetical protein